jgi:hypothetical protein
MKPLVLRVVDGYIPRLPPTNYKAALPRMSFTDFEPRVAPFSLALPTKRIRWVSLHATLNSKEATICQIRAFSRWTSAAITLIIGRNYGNAVSRTQLDPLASANRMR